MVLLKKKTIFYTVFAILVFLLSGCGFFAKNVTPLETDHDHLITVNGISYHYQEFEGPGENIFLLHGFSSSTYSWKELIPILNSKGYHVWTLDMKGFGWSDKPKASAYDPLTLMEEINTWMDAVGIKKVTFTGNSLGGSIAVLMAATHPEKIERLILIDSGGYPRKELPLIIRLGKMPFADLLIKISYGPWVVKKNLSEVFYDDTLVTEERVDEYYSRLKTKGALDAQVSLIRSRDDIDFDRYVKQVSALNIPTLIIWGKEDIWIPLKYGYQFNHDIKNSILSIIPECGHIPQEEKPDQTARLILDFMQGKTTTSK